MLELVDTHCHLDFDSFDPDREQILARAAEAGVRRILNPGIDLTTSQAALGLTGLHDGVYAAVGIHPNSAGAWRKSTIEEVGRLAAADRAVAIGEIGLDYYRMEAARDRQIAAFTGQLQLAARLGLPVVIHNRQAMDDILEILSNWHADLVESGSVLAQRPGVLHSFSGTLEEATRAIRMSFFIGITGPVTFKNATELQEVVAALPMTSLLVETDAPFLSPHPLRGRRNEPANVMLVVEKIATLHRQPVKDVARQTARNAAQLFSW